MSGFFTFFIYKNFIQTKTWYLRSRNKYVAVKDFFFLVISLQEINYKTLYFRSETQKVTVKPLPKFKSYEVVNKFDFSKILYDLSYFEKWSNGGLSLLRVLFFTCRKLDKTSRRQEKRLLYRRNKIETLESNGKDRFTFNQNKKKFMR